MIKKTLNNIYLKIGRCMNAVLNISGSGSATQSSVQDILLSYNNIDTATYVQPYGFVSVPNNGTNTVVANLGINGLQNVALGCINVLPTSSPLDLVMGETALFSNNFYFQVKNTGVFYKYNGYTATACSGEDTQTILLDVVTQLIDIYSQISSIWTQLNNHQHIVNGISTGTGSVTSVSMSGSGTTITPGTINPVIPEDQTFLENGQLLIDENGVTPVR